MTSHQGRDAVIVGAVRTPIGKGKTSGALHDVLPADLLAHSLRELVARTGVDATQIDDVIAGAVTQVGDQAVNIARNALLGAGFPETVPGVTIDRQCGSSQQAISFAAQGVLAGAYDLVVAGGVESMSRVVMGSSVLPGSNPFGEDMAHRYPDGSGATGHQRRTDRQRSGAFRAPSSTSFPRPAMKRPPARPKTGFSTTS